MRNVLIAIGNVPNPGREAVAAARHCLDDPSPLVRATAVWALGRIAGAPAIAAEAGARLAGETDATVRAEWHLLAAPAMAAAP